AFCPQQPDSEIEVVARRPHGYRNTFAIDADFERLFHDDFIFDMLSLFLVEFQNLKTLQITHSSHYRRRYVESSECRSQSWTESARFHRHERRGPEGEAVRLQGKENRFVL